MAYKQLPIPAVDLHETAAGLCQKIIDHMQDVMAHLDQPDAVVPIGLTVELIEFEQRAKTLSRLLGVPAADRPGQPA